MLNRPASALQAGTLVPRLHSSHAAQRGGRPRDSGRRHGATDAVNVLEACGIQGTERCIAGCISPMTSWRCRAQSPGTAGATAALAWLGHQTTAPKLTTTEAGGEARRLWRPGQRCGASKPRQHGCAAALSVLSGAGSSFRARGAQLQRWRLSALQFPDS